MTAIQQVLVVIRCNGCSREYPRALGSAAATRALARRGGWKLGRHPRIKHVPRMYDACPSCRLPEGYAEI